MDISAALIGLLQQFPGTASIVAILPVAIALASAVQGLLGATAGVPTTASAMWYQYLYQIVSAIANLKPPATILPPAIAAHRMLQDAAIDAGLPPPPAPPAATAAPIIAKAS